MGINYQPHAGERGISAILRTYEDPLFGCIESVTMAISTAPTAESTGAEAERQRGFVIWLFCWFLGDQEDYCISYIYI